MGKEVTMDKEVAMDKEQCIQQFWSSFEIPAYDERTVPASASMPYITYELSTDTFGRFLQLSASLWYHSTGWAAITRKANEIGALIGAGGILRPYNGGALWIVRGSPFTQRMDDPNDSSIRRIVLQIYVEFMSEN